MRDAANVKSVESLRAFRAALVEFRDVARTTLSGAYSDIDRAIDWLQRDQIAYWEREKRKWTELLSRAQSELYRKQTNATDGRASDVDERRAVEKAQRRLEEIERSIERTRYWSRQLERDSTQFRAQVSAFASTVDAGLPKAEARLEKLAAALDRYLATTMPDRSSAPRSMNDDLNATDDAP